MAIRIFLEESITAEIEGLNVFFHISNDGIYNSNVEFRYVVLKLQKNAVFPIKEKCL